MDQPGPAPRAPGAGPPGAAMLEGQRLTYMEDRAKPRKGRPERLHFLDWLRFLMVLGVVYAHTAKSGLKDGGGFDSEWKIDDRTIYSHASYRAMWGVAQESDDLSDFGEVFHQVDGDGTSTGMGPSPLAVRWISIARQWCLPMLFWVSGASVACSYRGGFPRGIDKLAGYLCLGVAFNTTLWFLSPRDDSCTVDKPACAGRGILFDFTIAPFAGWFVFLFQMWYVACLIVLIVLDWPLLAAMHGTGRWWCLHVQYLFDMALFGSCILWAGKAESDICPSPWFPLAAVGLLEVSFLGLVHLVSPAEPERKPDWLSTRAVHYLMGGVAALQVGAVPYAKAMYSIGPAYLSFLMVMSKRFFELGFVMTHARGGPKGDLARPLVSRAWPLMLILYTFVAPSTNWDQAGMLTWPYFEHWVDRTIYALGAVVMTLIVDRASRGVPCDPLPDYLGAAALVLYLFHPVLISVLLKLGLRNVLAVWLLCVLQAVVLVLGMAYAQSVESERKRRNGLAAPLSEGSEDSKSEES